MEEVVKIIYVHLQKSLELIHFLSNSVLPTKRKLYSNALNIHDHYQKILGHMPMVNSLICQYQHNWYAYVQRIYDIKLSYKYKSRKEVLTLNS